MKKLIAKHRIVRKKDVVEPGKPFTADDADAEYFLSVGAAVVDPDSAKAPAKKAPAKKAEPKDAETLGTEDDDDLGLNE